MSEKLQPQLPQSKNKSFSFAIKSISIILGIFLCIILIYLLIAVKNLIQREVSSDSRIVNLDSYVTAHELNVKGDKIVYVLCTKPIVIKITTTRGQVLKEFHLQQDCEDNYQDLFVSKDNVFYLYLSFWNKSDLIVFNEVTILYQDTGIIKYERGNEALLPHFSEIKSQAIRPVLELPMSEAGYTRTLRIIQYQQSYYVYEPKYYPLLYRDLVFPKLDYQGEGTLLKVHIICRGDMPYLRPQGSDFTITSWCPGCNCKTQWPRYIIDGVTFTSAPTSPHSKRYVASNNDIVILLGSRLMVLKPEP